MLVLLFFDEDTRVLWTGKSKYYKTNIKFGYFRIFAPAYARALFLLLNGLSMSL